jgi:hypothetical protein
VGKSLWLTPLVELKRGRHSLSLNMRLRYLAFILVCSTSLLPQLAHSASLSNASDNENMNNPDNANCHAWWLHNCDSDDANSGGDEEASNDNDDDPVIVDPDDPTDTGNKQSAGATVASTTTAANTAIGGLVGQIMSASGTNGLGGGTPSGAGSGGSFPYFLLCCPAFGRTRRQRNHHHLWRRGAAIAGAA